MDIFSLERVKELLLFIPPFILSLSFHEYAHAWVADKLGDSTARYLGRLTMDPMAHVSWVGTIIVPAFAVLTGAPLFGWANPIPIDSRNFKKPRAHMALVAVAGPLSNLLLAVLSTALISWLIHAAPPGASHSLQGMWGSGLHMLMMSVQLNLFLAFFNLIPIPPLDGSRILQGIVSRQMAFKIDQWGEMGTWILLLCLFTGLLRYLALPVYALMNGLFYLFHIG